MRYLGLLVLICLAGCGGGSTPGQNENPDRYFGTWRSANGQGEAEFIFASCGDNEPCISVGWIKPLGTFSVNRSKTSVIGSAVPDCPVGTNVRIDHRDTEFDVILSCGYKLTLRRN